MMYSSPSIFTILPFTIREAPPWIEPTGEVESADEVELVDGLELADATIFDEFPFP